MLRYLQLLSIISYLFQPKTMDDNGSTFQSRRILVDQSYKMKQIVILKLQDQVQKLITKLDVEKN